MAFSKLHSFYRSNNRIITLFYLVAAQMLLVKRCLFVNLK